MWLDRRAGTVRTFPPVAPMRVPVLITLALLVLPPAAHASELRTHTRELLPAGRTLVFSKAPAPFNLAGVSSLGSGSVAFRTREAGGRWSGWRAARPEAEDRPDGPQRWQLGNPWWTGPATAIQYRLRGRVERLRTMFVWSVADAVPLRKLAFAGTPAIIPRRSWAGSDTALRRDSPRYADQLRFAVVHHTAGASPSSPAESAAMVKGVAAYHVRSNGWDDIGYNFLVDRFGQIFEGRYGGIDRNVIGAHAQGFNTGSVGVALIGSYSASAPAPAAHDALARLLAWRLDVAHIDPLSTLAYASGGNPKYAPGTPVFLRAVAGHRDTGFTSCPGERVYGLLPAVARAAAESGQPKLYSPRVQGRPGGQVRFTARLSTSLPWRVDIADETGGTVASGGGTGSSLDWTWDATQVPPGTYRWTMGAGPTLRSASGTLAGGTAGLNVTASVAPATISPDGDGRDDAALVRYRLGRAATVTVTVLDALGAVVATLPQGQRLAGAHTLTWFAEAYLDGAYTLVLTAQAGAAQVVASVPVAVNRTLTRFIAGPPAFSPNADGRLDGFEYGFELAVAADVVVTATRRGSSALTLFAGPLPAGTHAFTWDGGAVDGSRAPDGRYAFTVQAANVVGTVKQTAPVVLDATTPRLSLLSRRPLRVRVSEPGILLLNADGRRVSVTIRRAGVRRVHLQGRRVSGTVEDPAGNRSRAVRLR